MASHAQAGYRVPAAPAPVTIPKRQTIPGLIGHPLPAFERIGVASGGAVVRLDLGLFRPFLVTRPEQVQHVLVDRADNYLRGEMLWRPVRRLIGSGLGSEGETHAASRGMLQPLFSARHVGSLVGLMAGTLGDALDELDPGADTGPVDAGKLVTRLVNRVVVRAFFGNRIGGADADRLGEAIATAFTSLGARMLLPFLPETVPLPGGRAFRAAVSTVDDIMYPLIRASRAAGGAGDDLVSMLCQARDAAGHGLTDEQVRDDVVAIFVAGSETTAVALTWLWVALDKHPEVAGRLTAEVTGVLGGARPAPGHLPALRYTRLVLQELLRLYPTGWLIPRTAQGADVLDGVPVSAGDTVLLSPYLTHRLPHVWDRPTEFDPERFTPEAARGRHRFAYWPFGGGAHQCLGSHFFTVEAQLIVAGLIGRYEIARYDDGPAEPRASVTLRPRRPVRVVLRARTGQSSPW